ncbi:MAG: hypothetical protein CMJ46_06315 [Planctomyces sp.]|nr:hypothetical protein [Planctomyces sp.]
MSFCSPLLFTTQGVSAINAYRILASALIVASLSVSLFADEQDAIEKMQRRNIVLEFTADWCTYCRQIQPMVSRLEREGYPIQHVNFDKNRKMAEEMGVNALPCFVLLVDGQIAKKQLYYAGPEFKVELNQMLTSATDSREAKMQELKTIIVENGRKRSLDGADASARTKGGADIRLVANEQSKGGFDFAAFGLGEKEETAAVVAPAIRPESNLGPHEKPVSFDQGAIPTVRIRANDGTGVNFGTGTIIASKGGKTYILSCGHIFRGMKQGEQVDLDVFVNGKTHQLKAQLVNYRPDDVDLGLLYLEFDYEFPHASIAEISSLPVSQDAVFSIGCGRGELPTRIDMQVTRLNQYMGPDTIECTTMPERGRSGGGLYTGNGELIGVCILAQPTEERGIYTSLKPIYQFLDHCKLSFLHPATMDMSEGTAIADSEGGLPKFDEEQSPTENVTPFGGPVAGNNGSNASIADNPLGEPASLQNIGVNSNTSAKDVELIQKAMASAAGAEIICLVRPKDDPHGELQVVVINKATPKLINYLKQNPQPTTLPTVYQVPGNQNSTNHAPAQQGPSAFQSAQLPNSPQAMNPLTNQQVETSALSEDNPFDTAASTPPATNSATQMNDRYLPPIDTELFSDAPVTEHSPWAGSSFDQ